MEYTYIGSNNFMSSERISRKEYSYPSDCLVLYELDTIIYPYSSSNDYFCKLLKLLKVLNLLYKEDFFIMNFVIL